MGQTAVQNIWTQEDTDDSTQTYIGHVLVSVNPFRDCALYDPILRSGAISG